MTARPSQAPSTRRRRPRSSSFLFLLSAVACSTAFAACASRPPSAEKAACLDFRTSSGVNDSSSIVLILVGVTNPEAFRAASPRELLSPNPPGTEGESTTIVATPGEVGSERVLVDHLSKRLGVIADYRNRTSASRIAVDLPIRCHWPKPRIDLLEDTIDE